MYPSEPYEIPRVIFDQGSIQREDRSWFLHVIRTISDCVKMNHDVFSAVVRTGTEDRRVGRNCCESVPGHLSS